MTSARELLGAAALGAVSAWVAIAAANCLVDCEHDAWADGEVPTAVAVSRLAPHLTAERARVLGEAIDEAASTHGLDAILVAAIVARESSYRVHVLEGRTRGALGETGAMQVHGVALRWAPSGCHQSELRCSLATGCGYLAWLRDEGCPGSTWRWVSAYGRRRCPSESEARRGQATRRAWNLYRRAGGTRWEL